MPINLSRVNISLAQFQAISSGKYNAGEVRLSGETSLAKMNNHVHLRRKNVETISHEETFTIKEAFVRALANSGVGADALNAIRRELGLSPDGKADRTLAERSIKPLSRQQIREILDRNAAAINAAKGAGTIVTDAQMHKGAKAAEHAAVRDETNAALAGSRKLSSSVDITRAQTLISGNVEFQTSEERKELLKLAKAQKAVILSTSGGKPATAPNGTIGLLLGPAENILSATLGLGMSESDYVNKLDEMILRLKYGDEPAEEDLAARAEFEALPDDAARIAWLDKLSTRSAEDGRKARAAVVFLLQEHGVNDYETLSLVNSIGNPAAVKLASLLVATDRNLTGDAFRQSADVRTFTDLAKAHPADLDDDSKTSIPGLSARKFNEAIYRGLVFDPDELPAAFARVALDVRNEMADRLGVDTLPTAYEDSIGDTLKGLVDSSDLSVLIPHNDDGVARVTPGGIRAGFLKAALEKGANKLLSDHIFEYASEHGLKLNDARPIVNGLLARTPNLIKDMVACRKPDEATAILDSISADARFQADMARENAIAEYVDYADGWAREVLAEELDLSVFALAMPDQVNTSHLQVRSQTLVEKIHSGEVAASTPDEVKSAFRDMAAKFARDRAETFRRLDSLQVSPELRTVLRTVVLQMINTDGLDLDAIFAAARKVDLSETISLVDSKDELSKVFSALTKVGTSVEDAAQAIAEAQGTPENAAAIRQLIYQIAIDQAPGGVKAFETFLDRADLPSAVADSGSQAIDPSYFRELLAARGGSFIVTQLAIRPIERHFLDGVGAVRAFEAGYLQSELPMLARTYALCVAAGMSTEDALAATIDPESKPRRLVRYGGRFTQSTESFGQGLKLMEKFGEWFANVCRPSDKDGAPTLDSFNKMMKEASFAGTVERFVFEEISVNWDLPIDAENPDDVFGMAKNPATSFIGSIPSHSLAHAVSRLPPAMRGLVYEVFDTIKKPAAGVLTALDGFYYDDTLISRTLSNYASLASLRAAGALNRESIISVLFPETFGMPTETNGKLMDSIARAGLGVKKLADLKDDASSYKSTQDFKAAKQAKYHAYQRLQDSGAPVPMFASLLDGGMAWAEHIPISFVSTFDADGMRTLGNPVLCEREAMKDVILFPTAPTWKANWAIVVPGKNNHFVFRFPDGTQLVYQPEKTSLERADQIVGAIADKLAKLCGNVHHEQLAAVYRALSSEGGAPLVNAFLAQGISTDARCPLVQTIARDATTGTISITHSNPEGFPFNFTWTTNIAVDGTVFNSPMMFAPGSASSGTMS